jgi:hypothetical protein
MEWRPIVGRALLMVGLAGYGVMMGPHETEFTRSEDAAHVWSFICAGLTVMGVSLIIDEVKRAVKRRQS